MQPDLEPHCAMIKAIIEEAIADELRVKLRQQLVASPVHGCFKTSHVHDSFEVWLVNTILGQCSTWAHMQGLFEHKPSSWRCRGHTHQCFSWRSVPHAVRTCVCCGKGETSFHDTNPLEVASLLPAQDASIAWHNATSFLSIHQGSS